MRSRDIKVQEASEMKQTCERGAPRVCGGAMRTTSREAWPAGAQVSWTLQTTPLFSVAAGRVREGVWANWSSWLTDAPRKPLTGWRLRCEGRGVKTDYVWAVDKQIIPETVPTFLTSSLLPHFAAGPVRIVLEFIVSAAAQGLLNDARSACSHDLHLSQRSPLLSAATSPRPAGFTLTFTLWETVLRDALAPRAAARPRSAGCCD